MSSRTLLSARSTASNLVKNFSFASPRLTSLTVAGWRVPRRMQSQQANLDRINQVAALMIQYFPNIPFLAAVGRANELSL